LDEFERAKAPTPPPAIVEQAATHSELQSVGDRLAGVEDAVRAVAAAVKCVAAFGPIADHTGAYSVAEAAKLLGIGEIGLFAYLRQERMLLSDNTPAQRLIDNKHFRVHPQPWAKPNGERRIHLKPMVTPKGLAMLQQRFDGKQEASK
jgi:phage antirepressor YoqD-like protein